MKVIALDHIVLVSPDLERSLHFYCDVLDLAAVRVDQWRQGTVPFPSVRVSSDTIIDLLPLGDGPIPDSGLRQLDHFCLVVEPGSLDTAKAQLQTEGVTVEREGPRFGARGSGYSIYFTGPEGITIELREYGQ